MKLFSKKPKVDKKLDTSKVDTAPTKLKKKFSFKPDWKGVLKILAICLLIGTMVSCGIYSYRLWNENQSLKDEVEASEELSDELGVLQDEFDELKIDHEELTGQNEELQNDYNDLSGNYDVAQGTIEAYEVAQARIQAYNNFDDYFHNVIVAHGGFDGWTQAEYEHAHDLAEATGDSSFVDIVEYAWNNEDIDPVIRITAVMKGIIDGINANL